jgi:glycerophosphoryl diester phosphodiesterase
VTFLAAEYEYFDLPAPRVFAHRGLHTEFPENTAGAFRAALAAGARYIETDVVASRDGVAMIAHDLTLERVASDSRSLGEVDAAELADIDLGGEGFISLRQALETFPEARLNIDVKDLHAVPDVLDAIRGTESMNRVLVTSFATARRRAVADVLPEIASSASSSEFLRIFGAARVGFPPPLPRIQALQIPARGAGLNMVTPQLVERYHRAGLEVHVWTVNDLIEMRRLLALGVDGIVTDRADLALAEIS